MFRKIGCAVVVLALCLSVGQADDIKGKIVKISDESVSIQVAAAPTYGEAKSYPLADEIKFCEMVKKDGDKKAEKKPIEGGLKASVFAKLDPKKGVMATILYDKDKKVKEIIVGNGPAKIVKISDESVSIQALQPLKYADAKSYPLTKDAKFFLMVKGQKQDIEGGVKGSIFKDIDVKQGLSAVIAITDNKVTEVRVNAPKKKAS